MHIADFNNNYISFLDTGMVTINTCNRCSSVEDVLTQRDIREL